VSLSTNMITMLHRAISIECCFDTGSVRVRVRLCGRVTVVCSGFLLKKCRNNVNKTNEAANVFPGGVS